MFSSISSTALRFLFIVGMCQPTIGQPGERQDRWNGLNPYQAPNRTSDYYGSGDVDLDGQVTFLDVLRLKEIVNGSRAPTIRADVSGDGQINDYDISLLQSKLDGGVLPGWWDQLRTRADRVAWLTKMLAIDSISEKPYDPAFRQCLTFSQETFFNFSGNVVDYFPSDFGPGQTVFNLPVYCVTTRSHSINAILVGEDPRVFDDWHFFEPQDDSEVHPGMWNMPFGTDITIYVLCDVYSGGNKNLNEVAVFHVAESGSQLKATAPGLLLTRPPCLGQPDRENRRTDPDLWEPTLLPTGQLLALKSRDDMSRISDIHCENSLFGDFKTAKPLVGSSQFSRLLDAAPGTDGAYHLIWRGEHNFSPTLFYGVFSPATQELTGIEIVATGRRIVIARVVELAGKRVHIVWLENKTSAKHEYGSGLYWTSKTGNKWSVPERILPFSGFLDWAVNDDYRDLPRYFFDLIKSGANQLLLVCAQGLHWEAKPNGPMSMDPPSTRPNISQLRFDGTWGQLEIIEKAQDSSIEAQRYRDAEGHEHVAYWASVGLDLSANCSGEVHLVYWFGPKQQPYRADWRHGIEGRGVLRHRYLESDRWSIPRIVDLEGRAFCPQLLVKQDGGVGLVWDKEIAGKSQIVWSEYAGEAWLPPRTIRASEGMTAWYPSTTSLSNGLIAVSWSERSGQAAQIGMQLLLPSSGKLADPVILANLGRRGSDYSLSWLSIPGNSYRIQYADSMSNGTWQTIGSPIQAAASRTAYSLPVQEFQQHQRFYRVVSDN
jgi:hypothetical protein